MSSASSIRRLGSLAVMAGLTLLAVQAKAQFTWIATASGSWSNTANWQGGTIPVSGATTAITFGAGTYTSTDDLSTNPFLLNSLTFNNTGTGANGVTLASANALDFVGTNPTITRGTGDVTISAPIQLGAAGTPVNLTTTGSAGSTLTLSGTITDNGASTTGGSNIFKTGAGSLVFSNTGASTFNQLSVQGGSASVTAGTLNLTAPTNTGNSASGLQIGSASGQTGTINVNSGAIVEISENAYIGDAAGSTGTLNISGAGTDVDNTIAVNSGRFAIGNSGTGFLNVTNSGTLNADLLFVGRLGGSQGTVVVDGVGTTLHTSSQLTVGELGTATMTVQNGASLVNDSLLIIGQLAGNGTLNITGTGTTATVAVETDIAPAVGATGVLNVQNGATFTSTGTIFLGGATAAGVSGGNGTLTVTGVGSTVTAGASVQAGTDAGSTGTVNVLNGATMTVGGNFFLGGDAANGTTPAGMGTTTVSGIGSSLAIAGSLIDGGGTTPGGIGTFTVSNGASVSIAGNALIGQNSGSTGTLNVLSGGSFTSGSDMVVGFDGASVGPPAAPNAVGIVNVSGVGSNITLTGAGTTLFIGGGSGTGGTGTLNVMNGGVVTVPEMTVGNDPTSMGTVVVSAGTLNVTDELDLGDGGPATLSILNGGGVLVGGNTFAGPTATITGAITLSGINSSLNVLGAVILGGSGGTPGGTGSITANDSTIVSLGPTFLFADGSLNVNSGPLGIFIVGGLGDGVGGATPSVGTVNIGTGSILTINTNGGNFQFDGVISGAGGIAKTGLGTQFLTATNTYTGPTILNGGAINFSTLANLGADTVTVGTTTSPTVITFNGGTLQYAAGNTSDISVRTVNILPGGATIDVGANNVTFAGSIGSGNPQNDPALGLAGFGGGALTKLGTGTLTLAPAPLAALPAGTPGYNNYLGGTNVLNGTLSVSSDLALGAINVGTLTAPVLATSGNVTGAAAGTLLFTGTTTTSRTFAMGSGTIAVSAGQTLTFDGSQVSGATLDGSGTFATSAGSGAQFISMTSTPSVTIVSNSAADQFVHVINGGAFTVPSGVNPTGASTTVNLNGFTNQGSGSVTIGTAPIGGVSQGPSQINVSNFQSYGTLTLNPAPLSASNPQNTQLTNVGTSPLFFNGGSRTFVGTPATANSGNPPVPTFVAGMDLEGKNLVIAGGLFVNNGYISDFSSGAPGKIIVDFGALYKGAGFTGVNIVTQNGGKVQAGNSPGTASYGQFVFGPGGVNNYVFAIDNAAGTAGPNPDASGMVSGWGLINAIRHSVGSAMSSGNFTWTATPSDRLTVAIDTLVNPTMVGNDVNGAMANFNPNASYSWPAIDWSGAYSGPTNVAALDAATNFDTGEFANPIAGSFGWDLNTSDQTLSLTYTPSAVPEPGTLALTALAGLGLARSIRRRRKAKAKA